MEDEKGGDEKLIAVPVTKLYPHYDNIKNYTDLPEQLLKEIGHFFEHYKDLEKGKWVKVKGWEGKEAAEKAITDGIARAQKKAA
jgi:inorganic pyrophosphatase